MLKKILQQNKHTEKIEFFGGVFLAIIIYISIVL